MDSYWNKFPDIRVIDAAYLLAGVEPLPGLKGIRGAPALVMNLLNLITQKTGAVVLATMPEERSTITQSEFQSLMAKYAVKPAPVVPAFKLQTAPLMTPEPQAAPVVEVPASEPIQATAGPKFSMSKAGLIQAHKHEWSTVERDLKDASKNGLSAAKAGLRNWNQAAALQWARAKGKLTTTAQPVNDLANAFHSMSNLPSRKHTLKR